MKPKSKFRIQSLPNFLLAKSVLLISLTVFHPSPYMGLSVNPCHIASSLFSVLRVHSQSGGGSIAQTTRLFHV